MLKKMQFDRPYPQAFMLSMHITHATPGVGPWEDIGIVNRVKQSFNFYRGGL